MAAWGVRIRITIAATLVVVVVLVIVSVLLVAGHRRVLTDTVDEVLGRQIAQIADTVDADSLPHPLPALGDDEAFARVTNAENVIVGSTTFVPDRLPALEPAPTDGSAAFSTVRLDSGAEYRIEARSHDGFVIHVGTPLDDVNDSIAALVRSLALLIPVAVVLLAALLWFVVGRALRPVERIRSQVAKISEGSLDRRVPEPAVRDEIGRLARTMNAMLARLEAAYERQRRFVADASHELRSPLARMRAELEVDAAHPQSADAVATLRSVLDETVGLQRLVDDLLVLARLNEIGSPRREPVDLDDIVLRATTETRPHESIVIDISGVSGAQVLGDTAQLARVVRNLLDNAVQSGAAHVGIRLAEVGSDAVLTVEDDGPGIPSDFRDRAFERFARLDEARSAASGGSGLGLAISQAIVTAHGGTITIDGYRAIGTRFVIRLPVAALP
jgi:signal transduction histidine kinase